MNDLCLVCRLRCINFSCHSQWCLACYSFTKSVDGDERRLEYKIDYSLAFLIINVIFKGHLFISS